MKYKKPKIEFMKIENKDNVAKLSNAGSGTGGNIDFGELTKISGDA